MGTILQVHDPAYEIRDGYIVVPNGGRDTTYDLQVEYPDGPQSVYGVTPQSLPYKPFVDVIVPQAGTKVTVYRTNNRTTFDVTLVPWHSDCDEGTP